MKQPLYREPPLPVSLGVVVLISAVAATIVAPANASSDLLWIYHGYTQCIGLCTLVCNKLLRLVIRQAASSRALRLIILLVSVPVGYEMGMALAALLFGHPVRFGAIMRMPQIGMWIMLASTIAIIYFLWAQQRIAESTAAHAEAQQFAAEAQLRLLQAQLEPHMLFNTLANLHSLIEVDAERAQLMVEHLIEFMRRTLSASRKETTILKDEFSLIEAYLKLIAIRMGPRLSFELILPDSLAQARLPSMLLQPLVENAVKHGLEPKVAGGTIRVEAQQDGSCLQISVTDTGVGLSGDMSEECYGTTHVRERLRTLYGDGAGLAIAATPLGGVCATVRLPR